MQHVNVLTGLVHLLTVYSIFKLYLSKDFPFATLIGLLLLDCSALTLETPALCVKLYHSLSTAQMKDNLDNIT